MVSPSLFKIKNVTFTLKKTKPCNTLSQTPLHTCTDTHLILSSTLHIQSHRLYQCKYTLDYLIS